MLKSINCTSSLKLCLRYYCSKPNDIVIAAAVRTPIVSLSNLAVESIESQLNTSAAEAVIKQATLPKNDIDELHLITSNSTDSLLNAVKSELIKKNIAYTTYSDGLQALQASIDKLRHGTSKVIIMSTTDSLPVSSLTETSVERLKSATLNGFYDAEIIPIRLQQNPRKMVMLTKDEPEMIVEQSDFHIATALVLTTNENATLLNIKPLARLLNVVHSFEQDYKKLLQELLTPMGLKVQDIHHWEIQSKCEESNITRDLELSSACIHSNNIPGIFDQPMKSAVFLQLTHLVHSLNPKKLGCALVPQWDGSTTALLCENTNEISDCLPLLTVYTKDPCPLCDMLIEELEVNFNNEYRLEKIFIDQKENVRYLRLFRHDIPALFLNGQFLCMHRLNAQLLRRKLYEIKNNEFNRMIS